MDNPLIFVLDVDDLDEAREWVRRLKGVAGLYKIGYQLFLREGTRAVEMVKKSGGKVFLDLKFHDIPRTVEAAARQCVRMGVDMFNVHASGGPDMLKAAVLGAGEEAAKLKTVPPTILGVTVLTSLDENAVSEIGFPLPPRELVLRFCRMVRQAGINGVVASPLEAESICKDCSGLIIVTPGIRPAGAGDDDQKRKSTPAAAIAAGADYLVVGRPIIQAPDPVAAAKAILDEAKTALSARKKKAPV